MTDTLVDSSPPTNQQDRFGSPNGLNAEPRELDMVRALRACAITAIYGPK